MANSLTRIPYRQLYRAEQITLNRAVTDCLLQTCGACGKPYDRFFAASRDLKALATKKTQVGSKSLSTLDKRADDAWNAYKQQLKASLMHPYAEVVEAAKIIEPVFNSVSNPTKLNYDREYGALSILLEGLKKLDPQVIERAMLMPHFKALHEAVENFVQAQKEQLQGKVDQPKNELEEAEKACASAFSELMSYIEVKAKADELQNGEGAIALLNALFAGIEKRLKHRETLKKKKKAEGSPDEERETDENIVEDALKEDLKVTP